MANKISFEIEGDYSVTVTDSRFGTDKVISLSRALDISMSANSDTLKILPTSAIIGAQNGSVFEFNYKDIDATSLDAAGNTISNTNIVKAAAQLRTIFKGFSSSTAGGSGFAWLLSGNSVENGKLGTNNDNGFDIVANNTVVGKILSTGEVVFSDTIALGDGSNIGDTSFANRKFFINGSDINGVRFTVNNGESGGIDDTGLECRWLNEIRFRAMFWAGYGLVATSTNPATPFPLVFSSNSELRFQTGTTGASRRFTVKQDGKIGINTTSPTANLSVNGTTNNLTGSWATFSDADIKNTIGPVTLEKADFMRIEPKEYTLKESFIGSENPLLGKVLTGFVANEIETIPYFSDCVENKEVVLGEVWGTDESGHSVLETEGTVTDIKTLDITPKLLAQLILMVQNHEIRLAALE